jgi:hypothetical protein
MAITATWKISLRRCGHALRHEAQIQQQERAPCLGERITVSDTDGIVVRAVVFCFDPPLATEVGVYTIQADEIEPRGPASNTSANNDNQARRIKNPLS